MDQLTTVLGTLLLLALLFALIRRGWAGRVRRQAGIPAPPAPPAGAEEREPRLAVPGMYVATTETGAPLERIAAHGLGVRARARALVLDEGVLFERQGAAPLFVPAADVVAVGTSSGMVGKFVEKDGLAVLTWSLGGTVVDTGFRTQRAEDKRRLLAEVEAIAPAARS
ncbi:ABC transporter permease [Kocuria oceani]|uniref:ABC transporter permease n=1 Tax=Kocuria oceani TaxID=988827 RepID=A0ABV9TL13_9MICC|nr:ABC transporter permease [Kocuria oceani]